MPEAVTVATVAEHGYESTRVADILQVAGVFGQRGHKHLPRDVGGRRVAVCTLHDLIDSSGMELIASEHAGDVSHAVALPATTLIGVSERSALGKAVREMTISDVAESEREAFVSRVTRGIAKRQQPRATKQAEELWDTAMQVVVDAWDAPGAGSS